jgi:hypothetical protein
MARHYRLMLGRRALLLLIAAGIGACSWFHHPTPQQQMLDALNRGNAAQASHIWQQMSQKDRVKFNRGEGVTPAVPPQQVVKTLSEMSPDDAQGPITIRPPNTAGGSLLDLPQLEHPQTAAPAPQPPASEPAVEQP